MKQLSILFVLLCLSLAGYSQITAASYGFTASSGTFSSISGTGTLVTSPSSPYDFSGDDVISDLITLPFNFDYCGVTYTSLTANSNGWISLSGCTVGSGYSAYNNAASSIPTLNGGIGLLMPFWDDLYATSGVSHAYYLVTGTAPNRVFTFEYNNYGRSGASSESGYIQVKLYETTNVIEYYYGSNTYSSPSATIGIANSTSDYQSLTDFSTAPTTSLSINNVYSFPANGQMYRWTPPPPCSGTPVAGTAVADVPIACVTDNITLSVTGGTVATGFTYQWQSSPDFTTWTNIAGATTSPYVTTETGDMYYRVIVTCPGSGLSATSTSTYVSFSPVCFCTPTYAYSPASTSSNGMDNFSLTGEAGSTINDNGPATPPASGYVNETGISIDLQQGNAYSGSISYLNGWSLYGSQIWIDFDDNGTFDISEEVTPVIFSSSYSYSDVFTMNIPITAAVGSHRMRVRYYNQYYYSGSNASDLDPCNSYDASNTYYYGTTRDYTANILAAPACTGTPSAGTAASSATLACPSTAFTLSATGTTIAAGLTYQWQSSASAAGPWTDIAGATSPTYSYVISAPTYFQLIVNCPASSTTATSTSVFVNYYGFCYCVPSYSLSPASTTYEGMDNFSLTGEAGSTINDYGPSPVPANGYEDQTAISIDLQQGNAYSGSISYLDNWSLYGSQIWIDFNDNGIFDISEEVTSVIFSASYSFSDVFTMNIPITAAVGSHRMRVRYYNHWYYSGTNASDLDPCNSSDAVNTYYYGTTRDYTANILAAPSCSGTPSAGTATASATLACPSTAFSLGSTGLTIAAGLTYQWQSSASASGPWVDIAGATTVTYSNIESAPTYYQLIVNCPASSTTATSTSVFVNYLGYCYCTPSYYYSATSSASLDVFSLTGYLGSTISDAGPSPLPSSGYQDRTSLPAVDLQQGGAYSGSLSYTYGVYSYENQIWIDFNDNGTFELSEEVTPVIGYSGYSSSDVYTMNIPLTAPTGLHRMRVRYSNISYSSSTSPDMDPCADYDGSNYYYYGTTRDYMANIIFLPPCSGTPVAGASAVTPTSGGVSIPFTLSLPGLVGAAGLTYQWQSSSSASGPWTDIAGATNTTYNFTSIFADTWFQCVVVCTATSSTTTATPVLATYVATPPCFPTSSSWFSGTPSYGIDAFNVAGFSGSTIADAGIEAAADPSSGYLDRTSLPAVTMEQGGVYASSATWAPVNSYQELQVWIDFNDNGLFETTEEVTPVTGYTTSGTTSPTLFNINVPAGAAIGIHNMRVRAVWELISSTLGTSPVHLDPCNIRYLSTNPQYYSGDVVDYRVNIVIPCPFSATAANGGPVCPFSPVSLIAGGTAPSYSWSGPDGFTSTSGVVTAPGISTPGVYTLTATDGTCTITATTTQNLLVAPPTPVVTPSVSAICNGGTATLTAAVGPALINLIPVQDFEVGVPTDPAIAVDGWNTTATSPYYITQVTSGTSPSAGPQSGSHFADFHSWSYSGISAALISPSFDMTSITGGQISFWVYRDDYSYLGSFYANEGWSVLINTTNDVTTATSLGAVPRPYDQPITGSVVGTSLPSVGGWYQYTVSIPATYTGTSNYVFFQGTSLYGDNCYLDNISMTGYQPIAPPVWTPVTDLYSDAGLTTPYVAGTAASAVYMHPTTAVGVTTTDYVATTTNGVCTSADTASVTVTAVTPITASGSTNICAGNNVTLTNITTGGTWSTSNTTVATVTAGGVVHGVAAGVDTVFYTVAGCSAYTVVNVSTFVTVTTGSTVICSGGLTTTLSNPTTGGTWTSSNAGVATVSAGGVVTTGAVGSAIITYTLPTGCSDTSLITSVAPPASIGGGTSVCYNGGTTTLTETTPGGTWSTSTGSVATISATTGSPITVTGLTAGTANITYSTTAGCMATVALTLNANPANITGTMAVCASGGATTLADATGSGTWASSNTARATVSSAGVVTGVTSGTVVISYTAANGCYDTALVTVNTLPAVITGTTSVCDLSSTTLADASTPGTWSTSTPSVTTVNASGMVTGLTTGTGTIIFTQTSTGCSRSTTVTVNALPGAISGGTTMCNNTTTTLTSSPAGGTWSSGSPLIASIEASTGIVHGLSVGTANITYTNGSGCQAYSTMTVNPSFVPTVSLSANPGTTVCAGSTVTFTPTITNGGTAPTYSWTVNGTPMSVASTYNYVPVTGDVVSLNIVSNMGCAVPATASTFLTMTVNPIVTPALTLGTAHTDTGCAGAFTTVYTYPVSAGAGATFQWYVNGSPVSGSTNYTYLATNGDVVTAVMTSTAGCLSGSTAVVTSSSITLEIVPFLVPNVTLTSGTGSTACSGSLVNFTTTETNGGTAPAYLWSVNGVALATGPTYFYAPANGDVVVVKMTSNYPCVAPAFDTAQITMTVGSTVTPVATISAHPGTTIVLGVTDTFTVSVVNGGAAPAYQWYINGVPVSGANGVTFITSALTSGDLVTCHVTNTDLCGGTTISNILVMSVTGSGGTGVNNVNNGEGVISMLPNPNNGSFVVKGNLGLSANEDMVLEVTNMVGQVVYRGNTQAKNGEFSEQIKLDGILANGMYILNVRSQHMNKIFHFVLEQK